MEDTFVALDIETTGTDPQRDAVIEIGAVRFSLRRVESDWSTLINPGRNIPESITQLTGITNEMVRSAPRLEQVLQELAEFVGDAVIVGHNIRFDLSFFERYHLFPYSPVVDTYELAAVLFPSARRYSLGALSQMLGIPLPPGEEYHRALTDARITQSLFLRLYERARSLPLDTIAEIVRLSQDVEWDAGWVFEQVLRQRIRREMPAKRAYGPYPPSWFESGPRDLQPLAPPKQIRPLDEEEIAALLQPGGPFARYFARFEHRPEQVEMARAVTQALSQSRHLMVEAGTGVGKSFAYLLPASLFALENKTRVLISTNTINLQEQLIQKDIPDLQAALGLKELRSAVLKGRGNYLCPRRFDLLRQQGPKDAREMRLLAKILVWLLDSPFGDRSELNLHGDGERETWTRVSAEDDQCTAETCLTRYGGGCPFYRARQAALAAHLVIVNHALLLSDVATGNRVLPEYDHLIVDEAHHLESATTSALTFRIGRAELERLLHELGGPNAGLLNALVAHLKPLLRPSELSALQQQIHHAADLLFRAGEYLKRFFQTLERFARQQRTNAIENYGWQLRVTPSTRTLPLWDEVELSWDAANETLQLLLNHVASLHRELGETLHERVDSLDEAEDVLGELSNLLRRLSEAQNALHALVSNPDPQFVYWLEMRQNGEHLFANIAPLRVGPLLEQHLWHEKSSIILTSATLTTYGRFDYLRNTLSADEADELLLGSPFDYENAALIYIPNDIPEPHTPSYQSQVERAIVQSCLSSGGRTLVLFTSYAQLRKTSQAIAPILARHDILTYEQGEGASPTALLESFKSSERAVLLGTRSFWEGVDVPGQALSVVMIVKLPFDVPNDPLIEARAEIYENPFEEYHLPEAVLKFRQGFGRLIRSASDRGVVVILDRRILSKKYGRLFLESLPPCTVRQGPLSALPGWVQRWLNL
jgi:DNA polymerase-3 subunit epsilon/ATP-dependent DNA helicase DinG